MGGRNEIPIPPERKGMDRGNKLQGYTERPSRAGLAAHPSDPIGWSLTDGMGQCAEWWWRYD